MTPISAVIITFNEEQNLERCLTSLKEIADEIIIVDSFSTDNTQNIAQQFGCTVHQQKWLGYSQQKNLANNLASNEYIFSIDADESLSPQLAASILKAKKNGLAGVYELKRLTNYCGAWIKHSGWYPDKKIRLFPKSTTKWEGEFVHETLSFEIESDPILLKGDLFHFSYSSADEHKERAFTYSKLRAEELYKKGKNVSQFKPYLSALGKFISMFIINLGFLDGVAGIKIAWISSAASIKKYKHLLSLTRSS